MKTCGALLVLLCCCLTDITQSHYGEAESRENEVMGAAQRTEATATASTQQTCQPDIHTVLREMSNLVAKLEVELRYTKTQVDSVEARLRASERTVEEQKVVNKELKEKQEEQAAAVRAVGGSVNLTGSQVEELRREREESRVSFSASLLASGDGHTGPFSAATPLVYRHVFTNVGNGYNPNTGIFTAPIRGVYHFVVFLHGGGSSRGTGVSLHKNGEHVIIAYSHQPTHSVNPSNGASLLLEVGDVVYVKLWHNAWVYDGQNRHTTFSGHLLFSM